MDENILEFKTFMLKDCQILIMREEENEDDDLVVKFKILTPEPITKTDLMYAYFKTSWHTYTCDLPNNLQPFVIYKSVFKYRNYYLPRRQRWGDMI